MNQKSLHNTSDEIIDFDDEYCENYNAQEQIAPEELQQKDNQISKEDQIQVSPDEEDLEQNNKDLDEENIIYDPKVKELNDLDINNKQAIIDILMNDDLIIKKELRDEDIIKEKNKIKYSYVKSALNNGTPDSNEKKSSVSKNLYQMESKEGDPEYVKDMNVAAFLLKDQIVEENEDVAKLLFDDITKTKSDKKILTGKAISQKIKETLETKKKHLEEIEAEMYKNQKEQETFAPKINKRKKDGAKRNLNSFLEAQNKFLKDVENKKQDILLKTESAMKEINYGKPKVNKKSEKMVEKIVSTGPAYLRLYNKRTDNNEKIKEVEEKLLTQQKKEEKERLEKENELRKNNPYKHIKSKINIHQSNKTNTKDLSQVNKSTSPKKLIRGKSAINVMRNTNNKNDINDNTKKKFDYKYIQTNKILFNKFISNFDEILISLSQGQKQEEKNNDINLEELDEYQYYNLLYKLGMVSYPPEINDKNAQNNEEEKNAQPENILKSNEKKLVNDSFNIIKLEGDKVKIIDIKNFLICVLDLQSYNLYQLYKANHEQELKDLFPPNKFKKEDIPDLIIAKQNEELLSKIDKTNKLNNKYFSLTTDNKIIFILDKCSNIKKDFNILSLNYRNQKKKNKIDKVNDIIKMKYPFKPEIDENSNKIYQKYKEKVFSLQNETVTSNSNSQLKKTNMEYIDRILLLDKKRIAVTQKIKEEMEKNQIKECTFKPRINNYHLNKKNKNRKDKEENKTSNDISQDNQNKDESDKKVINQNKKNKTKFDELYEVGKSKLKNKSSKTREEIELEEQKDECTFQPNIKGLNPKKIPKTNFSNDIYNEKEYKILYERLKHGRLQRMVKESSVDRYGLNNELKQFVKDNKEFNFIQNQQYFDPDDPFYYNTADLNNMMNNINNQFEQENIEKSNVIKDNNSSANNINKSKEINKLENSIPLENKDNNIKNIDKNISENIENNNKNLIIEKNNNVNEEVISENELEKEKNDDIPLLIIDVNIRQGVKKKIYVYDGDTPEALAEKFAEEQNLDVETKNKLQSLIQTHMQKLLTKIEEENQSNSEKSQNIHGQKNQ